MSEFAGLEIDGAIATLTLRRAEQRNALSVELLEALHARMDEAEKLEDVRVLVITGEGKAFCAGMDLRQVVIAESGDQELPHRLLSSLGELTLRIRRLPAVTVAKVNGAAIGGGCGLSCVCDISVTHEGARLGFPEVDLGLCPAVVAPWVVRKVGAGMARRILLMGGLVEPGEALRVGLVNDVAASRDELDARTSEIVGRLAGASARALAATKGLLNELDGSLDEAVIRRGARLSADVLATPEAQAALAARLR